MQGGMVRSTDVPPFFARVEFIKNSLGPAARACDHTGMSSRRNPWSGFVPFAAMFLLFFFTACASAGAGASDELSNAEWTVMGPIDDSEHVGNECPKFYADNLGGMGGERRVSNPDSPVLSGRKARARNGVLDFASLFPGRDWVIGYACLEFSADGGDCWFRMGSDDGLRAWLNGELVADSHVHGALNPDAVSFRAVLRKGANRLLVKVCQGTGSWQFSIKKTGRSGHEAFLKTMGRIYLTASMDSPSVGADAGLSFTPVANPAPLDALPLSYTLTDSSDAVIASGSAMPYGQVTVGLPAGLRGPLALRIAPEKAAAAVPAVSATSRILLCGNADDIFAEYSAKARAAAARASAIDVAASLEFLADRVDGKLDASLCSAENRIRAVSFIAGILAAMQKGPEALAVMPGYRQMAYRSAVDGSLQPYSLYIPKGYSRERKYSLLVMIHGYGGEEYTWGNYLASLEPEDFLIVSVFGRGDTYYESVGEQDVLDVMDRVMARYSVDPNRVYLMGNSMGGMGTWRIGTLYPDRFAAIAPFSGRCGTELLVNLGNVKTFVVHGGADATVPVGYDRAAVSALRSMKYDVAFEEIPDGTHSTWTEWSKLHDPNAIFDFFRSAVRNPSPERISAAVPYARYGRHYWVTVDELDTSGPLSAPRVTVAEPFDSTYPLIHPAGSFEARRLSATEISIRTGRIKALTVDLRLAGLDPKKPAVIDIDGVRLQAEVGAGSARLARDAGGGWGFDARAAGADLPRHDGGGFADLFTAPLLIVHGTRDAATADAWKTAAGELADWSYRPDMRFGVKTGRFRVKADRDVTDQDMRSANLLLLGGPDQNAVSARLSGALAPYYSGGTVCVQGKRFGACTLCLVLPNPLAAGRIMGYMDASGFRISAEWARNMGRYFPLRFRNFYSNELLSYPAFSPDVFVFERNMFQDSWSGWFDRNWENLSGR